jgi:hypothetical protein
VFKETYSKVHIGKHLTHSFPIQNDLKQGDALSPLIFNFALEYAIRKVPENQVELKLNGTRQFLAYAVSVNLLGDNIDTIKKKKCQIQQHCSQSTATFLPYYWIAAFLQTCICVQEQGSDYSRKILFMATELIVYGKIFNI